MKRNWVTVGGEVEPAFVQGIHEVVSVNNYANLEEINHQTGLPNPKILEGLKWLSDKGEITIYDSFYRSQSSVQNHPTIIMRATPLNKRNSPVMQNNKRLNKFSLLEIIGISKLKLVLITFLENVKFGTKNP